MFVVFEGGEGCGKSTQLLLLEERLRRCRAVTSRGLVVTREPGGTPVAEELRTLFKSTAFQNDCPLPLTEAFIVMAARAQHVAKVVLPALAAGKIVLCDRFLDSSYVYQGTRGGLAKELLDALARPILSGLKPDVTFVLNVPWQVAKARIKARQAKTKHAQDLQQDGAIANHVDTPAMLDTPNTLDTPDRLDSEGDSTFAILCAGFLNLVKENTPYPCGTVPFRHLIEGTQTPEQMHLEIFATLQERFAELK